MLGTVSTGVRSLCMSVCVYVDNIASIRDWYCLCSLTVWQYRVA